MLWDIVSPYIPQPVFFFVPSQLVSSLLEPPPPVPTHLCRQRQGVSSPSALLCLEVVVFAHCIIPDGSNTILNPFVNLPQESFLVLLNVLP